MRIAVCSDLHLEFGPISLENKDNADVLVLSGDILVAKDLMQKDDYGIWGENNNNRIHTFFQEVCERFSHVIYLMGNHEHYHGDFAKSLEKLRTHLGYLSNLYILEKQVVDIDGVAFVAGTLWTDMNKEDPMTLTTIRGYMNDYRIITNSNSDPVSWRDQDGNFHTREAKFLPEDSVVDHKSMLEVIDTACKALPNGKIVVCGHHSPSKLSTKPQYEKDVIVNGAYSSDLSEFILDRPQIKMWTHGHTHHEFDYMIGSTRIVCNPRGYHMYEDQADVFQLKTFEV
jgi:predicted phosphodiesterase